MTDELQALADNCQEKANHWWREAAQGHLTSPYFADEPTTEAIDNAMRWENRAAALRARAAKEHEA